MLKRRILTQAIQFCYVGIFVSTPLLHAQKPAAPSAPAAGNTGSATGNTGNIGNPGNSPTNGTRGTFGNNTNNRNTNNDGFEQQRLIFLSGMVMFDDGSPANSDIRIERVCNGSPHLEAHTDSKGRFSFQLGGQTGIGIADADASGDGFGASRNGMSGLGQSTSTFGGNNSTRGGGSNMMGCELRAAYPGYMSESVDLSTRRSMDDPRVGTIILHRLVNVKGSTISVVSAQAPKSAQKSYEKGMQLAQKGKFEEAEQRFASATSEYPKYAVAWYDLGRLQQRLNKLEDAKKSFLAAASADSHYVSPFDQLALLAAQQGKWEDAATYSKQATDLNPVEFPSSFWYSALANYNLNNKTEAEKAARALAKLDNRHRYPEAETMLAEFAVAHGNLNDAAAHLRTYLTIAPAAKNIEAVKHELGRLDQAMATQAKAAPVEAAH